MGDASRTEAPVFWISRDRSRAISEESPTSESVSWEKAAKSERRAMRHSSVALGNQYVSLDSRADLRRLKDRSQVPRKRKLAAQSKYSFSDW